MDFKECIERCWGLREKRKASEALGITTRTVRSYLYFERFPRPKTLEQIRSRLADHGVQLNADTWRKNYLESKKGAERDHRCY